MFMMVRSYIAKYFRNTLLSGKQTLKKPFNTNGSPRHLNIVSDFHTCSFHFFTSLNNHLKQLLNILYHVPHSYLVISNKTLILYFVNSNRHKKSACGRKGLRLILRSFLQVLDIAIITETSLINNIKENVSELVLNQYIYNSTVIKRQTRSREN